MVKKFRIFDSDSLKNIHKRVFFSITIFVIVYLIAFYRITDVMILKKSFLKTSVQKEIYEKGKIYDRNNILLASSIKTFSLGANPREIQDDNCSFTISLILEKILSIPRININKQLLKNKKFVWLKRNISPREHQEIINLGQVGLRTEIEEKRIYPLGNSTSHVVGFTRIDGVGLAGIEKGLENQLNNGKDIYLSIDSRLQESIREILIKTIDRYSADSGLSVVLDISTGEILSMNSYPDFDPNNNKTFNNDNLFNRAIQGNYEMGSTFKPITVANGLDKDLINSEMLFDVSKPIKYGKNNIKDFHPHNGKLNVKGIIVNSSNIGTALIANKIGKKNQKLFFKKLGFYKKINLEIDETANPLTNPNNWGKFETMTIGFGHGFAVTPLHLIQAYASIVNGGYKVEPTLLLKMEKTFFLEKIIKTSTSNLIRKFLRAVILETQYTGPRVEIEGYDIGGKTGTAELIDKSGRYKKDANRTTFISVFPISKPKYVVLAIIDNPKKIKEENYSITAATVAAPLVKNIILQMIKILGISSHVEKDIINASINNNLLLNKNAIF